MGKLIEREFKIAQNEKLATEHKTEQEKKRLIRELKFGLGDEIKKNPSKIIILKKNWFQRLITSIKSFFTKF